MVTQKKKRNKYGNNRPVYEGRTWDSDLELKYYQHLQLRKKAGEIKDVFLQVGMDLTVDDQKVCTYFIDFVVKENDDKLSYIEVKGKETKEWKIKWKHFQIKFRELTPPDSNLFLVKKSRYGFNSEKIIDREN